jgi:alkylated DNA repair dioxygenase AlkB
MMLQLQAEIPWNDGSYEAFGRQFRLPRLQAWFSNPGVAYRYASHLQNSHPWSPTLLVLLRQVEAACGHSFNAVLANCYRDGQDSVGWHADDEPDLGVAPVIASMSLGATRAFSWRPRLTPDAVCSLDLAAGTLLVMEAPFQRDYEHAVLQDARIGAARINLTFRLVEPLAAPVPL